MPAVTAGMSSGSGDVSRITSPSSFSSTGTTITIGANATQSGCCAGLRFPLPIPQGATILTAVLWLRDIAATDSGTACHILISAEKVANAGYFASLADYDTRHGNLTTEHVHWDPSAWASNTTYNTPDLALVVKEVVDQPSWVSGNYICLFVDDNASTAAAGNSRTFSAYENSQYYSARLYVEWSVAGTTRATYAGAQSGDDGIEVASSGNVNIAGVYATISASQSVVAFRCHSGSPMPAGVTIQNAQLVLKSYDALTTSVGYTIHAQNNPAAPIIAATKNNLSTRNWLGTTIPVASALAWPPRGVPVVQDVTAIVQDMVTSFPAASITDILFMFKSITGAGGRTALTYDSTAAPYGSQPGFLIIDYVNVGFDQSIAAGVPTTGGEAEAPGVSPGEATIAATAVESGGSGVTSGRTAEVGLAAKAEEVGASSVPVGVFAIAYVTAKIAQGGVSGIKVENVLTSGPNQFKAAKTVEVGASGAAAVLSPGATSLAGKVASAGASGQVAGRTAIAYVAAQTVEAGAKGAIAGRTATRSLGALAAQTEAMALTAGIPQGAAFTRYWPAMWPIDMALYPTGTVWYLYLWLRTQDAGRPCIGFLWNEAAGEVPDSRITSYNTTSPPAAPEVVGPFTLTGSSSYSIMFGGSVSASYWCHGAVLLPVCGV